MLEQIEFSNKEILNSTLLSSMSYMEDKFIHEGDLLQQRSVSKIQITSFLKNRKINKDAIKSTNDLDKYVNLFLEEIMKNPGYKNIITQKSRFYESFKEELKLEEKSVRAINVIAKKDAIHESKKLIVNNFITELNLSFEGLEEYQKTLEEFSTQVKLREEANENKQLMNRDVKSLWEKFSPISFSEEMQKKYKKYDPKNDTEVQAKFNNGYIEAGKIGKYKDACLLIGYVKEKDDYALYISFRGTEQKVKSALKYFLENYPNMERQYNYFDPILKEIIQEEIKKNKAINPDKKLKVIFTGHSLGAALAEKALDKFQDNEDVFYKGIFVSNPGSFHYFQSKINKLDEWDSNLDKLKDKHSKSLKGKFIALGANAMKAVIKATKANVLAVVGLTNYFIGSINIKLKPLDCNELRGGPLLETAFHVTALYSAKFLNIGTRALLGGAGKLMKKVFLSPFIDKKQADPRACTINHEKDNIPQIGKALFQNHNPQQIILSNSLPNVDGENLMGEIFQIEYHGREVYYAELKKKAEDNILFKAPKKIEKKSFVIDRIAKIRENWLSKSQKKDNAKHI